MKQNTQQQARQVADELLKEGVRPTQQNVRERLGTGSITTINKALNQWWLELGERLEQSCRHPMLPDPVAESANNLWQQAISFAEEKLAERRGELETEFEKLKAELGSQTDSQTELMELRSQCLRLLQEADKNQAIKHQLQHRLALSENEVLRLESKNNALQIQIKQLEALGSQSSIEQLVELQIANKTCTEENKQLKKQIDILLTKKTALQLEIKRRDKDNQT